jgi:hypothetical protein
MIYTNVYIMVYTMIYTIIVMVYTIVYTIFLLYIYHGIYHGIYHLPISYIPWYIPKVVYTTFGVVYTNHTMRQPSRWAGRVKVRVRRTHTGTGRLGITGTDSPERRFST